MPDKRFVMHMNDLIQSTVSFFDQPEYWRESVGSSPKYFSHYFENDVHYFGLSKYCAFRNVTLREYILSLRNTTNGNITQKHIAKLAGTHWISYSSNKPEVRHAFSQWIHNFYPVYRLENASFISLSPATRIGSVRKKKSRAISPEDLQKRLQHQTRIGKVGELIALKYEVARLSKLGIAKPMEYIDHVSKRNSAAGFDIWSCESKKSIRYIEVKSSTTLSESFYITKNEIETLTEHGPAAYLYIVLVKNIEKEEGEVIRELQNPIKHLKSEGSLVPILFQAELKRMKIDNLTKQ